MADTILVDSATLESVFQDGLRLGLNSLQGCVPEVFVSPENLATILAGDFGRIDSVVGPSEFGPTLLATK